MIIYEKKTYIIFLNIDIGQNMVKMIIFDLAI